MMCRCRVSRQWSKNWRMGFSNGRWKWRASIVSRNSCNWATLSYRWRLISCTLNSVILKTGFITSFMGGDDVIVVRWLVSSPAVLMSLSSDELSFHLMWLMTGCNDVVVVSRVIISPDVTDDRLWLLSLLGESLFHDVTDDRLWLLSLLGESLFHLMWLMTGCDDVVVVSRVIISPDVTANRLWWCRRR